MTTSQTADFHRIQITRITSLGLKFISVIMLSMFFISTNAEAQDRFKNDNSRQLQLKYKKQTSQLANACHLLEKKRTNKPKRKSWFGHNTKPVHYAEGTGRVLSYPNPKPKPGPAKPQDSKPTAIAQVTETPSPEKLEALHRKEDEVLAENNLPPTTSANHERIRKEVEQHLKSKKDNEPIELAPLYFTFAEDEFSVVDMEPFLVAVEYALQGRIVLIEGHTDSDGNANYNNQLSIKRVQKIRQLMLEMGVSDDRISIVGYGEGAPKHDNTTNENKQKNRRVDFKVF